MKREIYYDAIKCLAILMVCMYHFTGLNLDILKDRSFFTYLHYLFISSLSICVPLFFMVNGALLLNQKLDIVKHIKKTASILILVYVWAVLILLILIPICGDTYTVKEFLNAVWKLKLERVNHLWFLQVLVSIYLLFPLMKLAYDQKEKTIFYYFCFIVFFFSFINFAINSIINVTSYIPALSYFNIFRDGFNSLSNMNPFAHYFYSLFYFCLGAVLSVEIKNNRIKISNGLLIVIWTGSLLAQFTYGVVMTLASHEVYDNVWNGYYSLMTLAMCCSTFILCSRISYSNDKIRTMLSFISKNTLGIYILHVIFGHAFMPLFQQMCFAQTFFANILFGIAIIFLSLSVTLLIKNIPILSKLLTIS
jgi:surface polysaccharide O-acyltransferase-like enzyme